MQYIFSEKVAYSVILLFCYSVFPLFCESRQLPWYLSQASYNEHTYVPALYGVSVTQVVCVMEVHTSLYGEWP